MDKNEPTRLLPALGRVFWMLLGPMLLVLLTFAIVEIGSGWLTAADLGFFAILAAILFARWLEFRAGHAQTASGEPATGRDLQRYVVGAGLVGMAVWVVANVLGNYVLAS
jgi:hypothetical protein